MRRHLVIAACAVAFIASPCIWIGREYRQQNLNRALIAAIKRSDAGAVKLLLTRGADPNTRDTPITHESPSSTLKRLMHHSAPGQYSPALAVALRQFDEAELHPETLEIMTALIAKGADVNAKQQDDDPNIVLVVQLIETKRSTQALEALLSAGARIEATDQIGDTALCYAAYFGNDEYVKRLLAHGANPNPWGPVIGSPLSVARTLNFRGIAKLLKEHGARE